MSMGIYRINQTLDELAIHPNLWLGQLQVVMGNASRITGRPELIPDPITISYRLSSRIWDQVL
jgi:hypothetical protein